MAEEKKIEKKPSHRPLEYTDAVGLKICSRIANGESVRTIVKDEDMPSSSSIFRWLLDERFKSFWEQYEKARNIQMELMFEELLDIADDGTNDWVEKEYENGNTSIILNGEAIGRSRLRVDTRKWYLSKVAPKKFGEKIDVTTAGQPIQNIIGMTINKDDITVQDKEPQAN